MEDPEDRMVQSGRSQIAVGMALPSSPCFPVASSHAAGCRAKAWGLGVREPIKWQCGGRGREREDTGQITPNKPLLIPFISKQTLGPVFPALKDFYFFFKPCCNCC